MWRWSISQRPLKKSGNLSLTGRGSHSPERNDANGATWKEMQQQDRVRVDLISIVSLGGRG